MQKIITVPNLKLDALMAIFLLKRFGEAKYPGIKNADILTSNDIPENKSEEALRKEGIILINFGRGKFDNFLKQKSISELVAEDLNIKSDKIVQKILFFIEKENNPRLTVDKINKLFYPNKIIESLNRTYSGNPQIVFNFLSPLLEAYFESEEKQFDELSREFEEKKSEGKIEIFEAIQKNKKLKVMALESDFININKFIFSQEDIDVLIQKIFPDKICIFSPSSKKIDLRTSLVLLRLAELQLKKKATSLNFSELAKEGIIEDIPEWEYDEKNKIILSNGTNISFDNAKKILKDGLEHINAFLPKAGEAEEILLKEEDKEASSYFFIEIKIPKEISNEIRDAIFPSLETRLFLPEQYRITIFYERTKEMDERKKQQLMEKLKFFFKKIDPFEIEFDSKNIIKGRIGGYKSKVFYFPLEEKKGGQLLREIRFNLENIFSFFPTTKFVPHLAIADVAEEKIFGKEGDLKIRKDFKIKFMVDKIRFAEGVKEDNAKMVYKKKLYFLLGQDVPPVEV